MPVYSILGGSTSIDKVVTTTLAELLPRAFTPAHLDEEEGDKKRARSD